MKPVKDADITSTSRVLVRCDLDVPLKEGKIKETFRLDHLLPTLNYIKEKGAKSIICGHVGRPGGKYVESLSTKHLKEYFDSKLGQESYELLENLRFTSGERSNSEEFAEELAAKADIYVNESFANSHRSHASIVGVPKLLPAYAGFRVEEEIAHLEGVLKNPEKPLVAVIGGIKVETREPVVLKFLEVADKVLVGGKIGLSWSGITPANLHLPHDYGKEQKDIGPETIALFQKELEGAKTIVWAGPLGAFEEDGFVSGTKEVGEAIANSEAFSLVGGGDTIAALHKFGLFDRMSFVSIGGAAMLEFFVKGNLVGLEALKYHA